MTVTSFAVMARAVATDVIPVDFDLQGWTRWNNHHRPLNYQESIGNTLIKEAIHPNSLIEENCFKAIKFSLEIPVVPIRKFLILFYVYLKILFGKPDCNLNLIFL